MKKIKRFCSASILMTAIFIVSTHSVLADPWVKCACFNYVCQWCNAGDRRTLCTGETELLFAVCYGQNCSMNPCYLTGSFQWYTLSYSCKPIPGSDPPMCLYGWWPTAITGATSVSYEVTAAGTYWCEVTCGGDDPYETDRVEYIYYSSDPSVGTQPEALQDICLGDEVSFSLSASYAFKYQWQQKKSGGNWSNISGANSNVYTFTPDATFDQAEFRCYISNGCGNETSNVAALDINFAPSITNHPASVNPCEGTSTNFSVAATGDGLSYQWQRSENQGGTWSNQYTSGKYTVTGNQMSVSDISADMDDLYFRCVVSGTCTPAAPSNPAILSVKTKPSITSSPTGGDYCTGENITLSVTAEGTEPFDYYWRKDDVGLHGMWTDSTSIHIKSVTTADAGAYDVLVRNECETSGIESFNANVVVKVPPTINSQMNPDPVCQGEPSVQFSVSASGDNISHQWQMRENSGTNWSDLSNSATYSGATSSTLNISSPLGGMNGQLYRCRVEGDCSPDAYSTEALLTVNVPPSIDEAPQPVTICLGGNFTLEVSVSGTSPSYLWRKNGISLTGWISSSTYSITGAGQSDAGAYDVLIKNVCTDPSSIESDDATVTVNIPPSISSHPEDVELCEGSQPSVSFSTTVAGSGLSYQWEYMINDNQVWNDLENNTTFAGVATDELIVNSTDNSLDQYAFRCKIIGVCDPPVTTDYATLSILTSPEITEQPENKKACEGYNVTMTVAANGSMPLQYRWKKDGVSLTGWTTEASLQLSGLSAGDAGEYNVLVDNMCSSTPVESDIATVTVDIPPNINVQPADKSICEGPDVSFSTSVPGSGLSYQWEFSKDNQQSWTDLVNNDLFSGVTTDVMALSSTDDTLDQYAFRCKIIGVCEPPVTTDAAILTIKSGPEFITHPHAAEICEGEDYTFSVEVTGTEPFQYRWMKGGASIGSWIDENTYTIYSAELADDGNYKVKVKNECNTVGEDSEEAKLDVNPKPYVSLGDDQHICSGESTTIGPTGTYTSYSWSTSETTQTIDVSEQGSYEVTVTDNKGCMNSDNIYIIVDPLLPVIDLGEDRRYCSEDNVTLDAGSGFDDYSWSDGSSGQTLSVYSSDQYFVAATANHTVCISTDTVNLIIAEPYDKEEICLVTVDEETGKNTVVFEKTPEVGILSYNIYRESNVAGVYDQIGNIPVDNLTVFVDEASNPEEQQYLYKISALDTCGNESKLSLFHKTLFLQYSNGVGGITLGWKKYEIEGVTVDFDSYIIYRGSDSTKLKEVKTISGTNDAWTDKDPLASAFRQYYRIAGVKGDVCDPDNLLGGKKADSGPYSHSLSNVEDNRLQAVPNREPTDIGLDNMAIDENEPAGSYIGKLTTTDPDVGDTHTYTLVSGEGDTDNASFTISDDGLLASISFDFETQNSFSIRVRTTDATDTAYFDKQFTITVNDVTESTGLSDQTSGDLRIYPNPFSHSVIIEFPNPGNKEYNLAVTDLAGKVILLAGPVTGNSLVLQRGNLASGYYFIELRGEKLFRGTVIIE